MWLYYSGETTGTDRPVAFSARLRGGCRQRRRLRGEESAAVAPGHPLASAASDAHDGVLPTNPVRLVGCRTARWPRRWEEQRCSPKEPDGREDSERNRALLKSES
jgi:hypothetical protein